MRDIVVVVPVVLLALVALRYPWVGVMCWNWLSLMNPHRYTYGFAYDAPLAALIAVSTMAGFLATRQKSSPFKGAPVAWLAVFMVWITLSWFMGLDRAGDQEQWSKIMKIDIMILLAFAVLHSRLHLMVLCWVSAGSLAILGAKGGVFTVLTGGNYRVWGPPGSFIADNNEFALSMVMTIPLLRFLQLQLDPGWRRHVLTVVMLLCAASALGSQSRGALLAISAMVLVLWWRGRSRIVGGILIAVAAAALVFFMPESWEERMSTIKTYEEDRSALGRISAWWTAWGVAKNYPLGIGFDAARPELVQLYSPFPDYVHAAHSIYFQVLGNHGFIGLFIFLAIFVTTYRWAGKLRREGLVNERARWAADLGAMAQVSLVAYAVGGAFLSLAYFDLPYIVMMLVVLARVWVLKKGWETEPAIKSKWAISLGLGRPQAAAG